MNELTIEEKAKCYDEAIKKAKYYYDEGKTLEYANDIVSEIFPELKESEDERIRKIISNILLIDSDEIREILDTNNVLMQDIDTWLEKQGESNPYSGVSFKYNGHTWGMCARDNGVDILLDKQLFKHLEKQGEQKTVIEGTFVNVDEVREDFMQEVYRILDADTTNDRANQIIDAFDHLPTIIGDKVESTNYNSIAPHFGKPIDKVEPKFKVGDWIIHQGTDNIYQIIACINNQYQLKYGDNYTVQKCADVDRCARLWNITKDAKRGDMLTWDNTTCVVLFKNIKNSKCFISYCFANDITFEIGTSHYIEGCHPATKEQRDTLKKAMANAGYEWNTEKKELKKIK